MAVGMMNDAARIHGRPGYEGVVTRMVVAEPGATGETVFAMVTVLSAARRLTCDLGLPERWPRSCWWNRRQISAGATPDFGWRS